MPGTPGFPCLLTLTLLLTLLACHTAPAADGIDFATIHKAPRGRSAMYAQLTPLADGTLLCVFRDSQIDDGTHGKKGSPWTVPDSRIVAIRSTDGGHTWTHDPVFIYSDPANSAYTSQCGHGYQAPDGTILAPFYVVTMTGEGQPLHIHWNLLAASRDNGATWTTRRLPSAPFLTNPHYGGIHALPDGRLWRVERSRGYGITRDEAERGEKSWLDVRPCVRIMQSADHGRTWRHHLYVGYDPTRPKQTAHYPKAFDEDEPALIRLPTGRILLLARPTMYQAISDDDGATWRIGPSPFTRKGAHSGLCPDLLHTPVGGPRGTLVLAYHDRWGKHERKGGVYLAYSHDHGDTWSTPVFLDGGAYPTLLEHPKGSGRILCAYYHSSRELKAAFFSVPSR